MRRCSRRWRDGVAAVVLGAVLTWHAGRLVVRLYAGRPAQPMRMFAGSTAYLLLLFTALAVDVLLTAPTR